jgi:hypothetical protein
MPVDDATKKNLSIRESIGDAYGFVRGSEYTKTVGNVTYAELLSLAIDRLNGNDDSGNTRASRLERVQQIKDGIKSLVDTVKKQPPEAWTIDKYDIAPDDAANPPEQVIT